LPHGLSSVFIFSRHREAAFGLANRAGLPLAERPSRRKCDDRQGGHQRRGRNDAAPPLERDGEEQRHGDQRHHRRTRSRGNQRRNLDGGGRE
jgi:hypothetical protein